MSVLFCIFCYYVYFHLTLVEPYLSLGGNQRAHVKHEGELDQKVAAGHKPNERLLQAHGLAPCRVEEHTQGINWLLGYYTGLLCGSYTI